MTSQIRIRKSGLRIRIRKDLFPPKGIRSENLGVFLHAFPHWIRIQHFKSVRIPPPAGTGTGTSQKVIVQYYLLADQNQSLPAPTYVTVLRAWLTVFTDMVPFTCCSPVGSCLLDVRFCFSCVRWQEFVCDCCVGDKRQAEQASGCLLWRHGKLCPDTDVQFLICVLNPA
jgi:hypothetical protein